MLLLVKEDKEGFLMKREISSKRRKLDLTMYTAGLSKDTRVTVILALLLMAFFAVIMAGVEEPARRVVYIILAFAGFSISTYMIAREIGISRNLAVDQCLYVAKIYKIRLQRDQVLALQRKTFPGEVFTTFVEIVRARRPDVAGDNYFISSKGERTASACWRLLRFLQDRPMVSLR